MDFESTSVVQSYQSMLFNGGLWIGIGVSTALAALFELGKYFYDVSKKATSPLNELSIQKPTK